MKLEIFTDGGCSGNPGPAAIGVVIKHDGKTIKTVSRHIGDGTNNIAEYTALIVALEEAVALKATEVDVTTDSELMCKQVLGIYKVKEEHIKALFNQVKNLVNYFQLFRIKHVLRSFNKEADALVAEALKKAA